ncbi:transglutaminase-like domain-containing protein [Polymorphobacter fuscus]|uniref:Transglutaminase family protein n=1 Tax=Sandarakinorhabdus fusca TaxID=1439888 RepID=A0A7C9KY50_9SPHN|nr:transglutaminase family protein [Polymorphobacter fuscus]KAB7645426.1 transglutaminase family protein [Polymorphobacter fuscus]MQT17846.1 transglutaminase family protein [Polymorphobacter fuscus]NJC08475.1 transglutaminase-like putative cysteine protease [Polymorphobacter fuscus]
MLIRAGYDISFSSETTTPMLAMLNIHPSRNKDLKTPHRIIASPDVPMYDYVDAFGNNTTRFVIPAGGVTLSCDFVIEDSGLPDTQAPDAPQVLVEDLPDDILVYLLGSRYCETDRLSDVAWSLFGGIAPGWARVQAIVDYVHNHIEFGYGHARSTKTAWDAYQEGAGVCRDFAHLAVTLCRCMNIPARYCTGYLGDIGIPPVDAPMDFSAWFDVYLGGEWYTFDARHNRPRIGRILMARGRDATDTALTNAFGRASLVRFDVHTDEVAGID